MKDITIIIPLHIFNDDVKPLLDNAVNSVNECAKVYEHGKLKITFVFPKSIQDELSQHIKGYFNTYTAIDNFNLLCNDGDTDFCSQINFAVDDVSTDFFSILEFDDEYTPNWFNIAARYYVGNENVSVFLPVNLFHDGHKEKWQYGNTMAISPMFMTADENDKDEIGIINYVRLEKCSLFNLTGGIFNTSDFKTVGKYKPSIQVAFNYEFLLRLTKQGLKAMVVPKEGYIHGIGREGSLTETYMNDLTDAEREKWFALALRECDYTEDRKKDIANIKEEAVK